MAVLGCHGKKSALSAADGAETPAVLAARAATVISAVCTRQSYATASVGLIAGETGLREDVFELRDPVSYRVIPYQLGTTVRLEGLLRHGAGASGRPAEQSKCMSQFADHLKTLTDPLVQTAKDEKDIDVLAFKDAEKEAQQQTEIEEKEAQQQTEIEEKEAR
ncbi:MAG: hypothetical protein ABI158_03090 [Edaphobacter sp.]